MTGHEADKKKASYLAVQILRSIESIPSSCYHTCLNYTFPQQEGKCTRQHMSTSCYVAAKDYLNHMHMQACQDYT